MPLQDHVSELARRMRGTGIAHTGSNAACGTIFHFSIKWPEVGPRITFLIS
jgi:hypothetical protein